MANSDYFGLANSLSRARRPPAQNDVYLQHPRGGGGMQAGAMSMAKPGWGAPYGGMQQQGFGSGGFGSGLAGINATGGFQNPVSMAPPMPGGGIHMMPPAPGMQVPGFGGGPTMGGNMDPNTTRLARPNVPGFGGGPQPGPKPMMLPPNPYGGPKP